jgi:hypothetical protein
MIPDDAVTIPDETWKVPRVETPETFNCLANNVVPVTVVIPANVETPDALILATAILGESESPVAVVAVPVRLPTKLDAVTTPEAFTSVTLILGLPDNPKEVVAKDAVDAVPVRLPTKLVEVTIPVTLIPLRAVI